MFHTWPHRWSFGSRPAALSGPIPKAPGFAGGYLLATRLQKQVCCELFRVKRPSLRAKRSNPSFGMGGDNGLLRFARNDVASIEYNSAISRRDAPELSKIIRPKLRGRRECRVLAAPSVSRAKI